MDPREELQALRRMAELEAKAGNAAPSVPKERSMLDKVDQFGKNSVAGLVRGAGSIGATIVAPYDMAKDALAGKGLSLESNRQRRADMDAGLKNIGVDTDSIEYSGGKLTGEILGTAGTGGVLANGLKAVAPSYTSLAASLASNGLNAGGAGAAKFATRVVGGAGAGAAAAGIINPEDAAMGAVVGGALPGVMKVVGEVAGRAGNTVKAVVQPFTKKGQDQIAGKLVKEFAEGGPIAINDVPLVPGSYPTLAEATGNAGIARLQSAARDIRPNAFVERESSNAAARLAAFDDVAGDVGKLDFFRAQRSDAAEDLYSRALNQSNAVEPTPYVKGQITHLLKRPSIDEASRTAQKLALERGEKPAAEGSLRALHDVKTALDDKISEAVRAGKGGEAKALGATKTKLLDVMEKLSPDYAEARVTYAAMSNPVNAMESLQGLRLTDAKGNITLSKVQNALDSLGRKIDAPGVDAAKSINSEQMNTLKAIRDDLLRQTNTGAGKSAGSNTFQNIATDNMVSALLPGNLGGYVNNKFGGVLGQAGQLLYNKPNEAIKNRLVDMMLEPTIAKDVLSAQQRIASRGINPLVDRLAPAVYRSAPAISSSR